jgi:serine/threonine protein phosphatase PrpC
MPSPPADRSHEPTPPRSLRWSAQTHVGRVRTNNEDAFLALTFDAEGLRRLGKIGDGSFAMGDFLFAVSDGMGGAKSGEFASRIAVDQITRLLPRSFRQDATGLATSFGDILNEVFARTHTEVSRLGESYEECRGMGATLTLAWFKPGWLCFAHVGDSRLYYLPAQGNGLRQLSHDDTHVGWLRRQGKMNEREQRTHPRRNLLSKALGAGHQFVDPQLGAVSCEPGDRFLLCSDGLIDGFWDHALGERLSDTSLVAASLVAEAVAESGRDNTTAVIIDVVA